jgi:hemerythrin-like domain-containing protein
MSGIIHHWKSRPYLTAMTSAVGPYCPGRPGAAEHSSSESQKGVVAMNAAIATLGNQHQDVLARLGAVESDLTDSSREPDLAAFAAYLEREVASHFVVEEQALFPILARHLSLHQGPLAVMNAEHAAFRDLLRELCAAVRDGNPIRQRRCASELIELLRVHIAKEDNILFPMASRILGPEELREVDARAQSLAGQALSSPPPIFDEPRPIGKETA